MRATSPRAHAVTFERIEDERPPAQLLRFEFDAPDAPARAESKHDRPRSIKEALIRWLEQQL